jgi:hypothetical protein
MSGTDMEPHEAQELAGLQAVIVENLPVTVLSLDARLRVTSASALPNGPSTTLGAYLSAELMAAAELQEHLGLDHDALSSGFAAPARRVEDSVSRRVAQTSPVPVILVP